MPRMQVLLGPVNAAFAADRIGDIDADRFRPGDGTLLDGLDGVVGLDAATRAYLGAWPTGLLAAVQGILHDNLSRTSPVPVTFAWAPGYDYEVTFWDVADTTQTQGGITILFKSRYPDDAHPILGSAG